MKVSLVPLTLLLSRRKHTLLLKPPYPSFSLLHPSISLSKPSTPSPLYESLPLSLSPYYPVANTPLPSPSFTPPSLSLNPQHHPLSMKVSPCPSHPIIPSQILLILKPPYPSSLSTTILLSPPPCTYFPLLLIPSQRFSFTALSLPSPSTHSQTLTLHSPNSTLHSFSSLFLHTPSFFLNAPRSTLTPISLKSFLDFILAFPSALLLSLIFPSPSTSTSRPSAPFQHSFLYTPICLFHSPLILLLSHPTPSPPACS